MSTPGPSGEVVVEVAVDSVQGVCAATEGGADRIELCSALELGGLTPSAGLCARARAATALPIFAILRLRPGDFSLDADDLTLLVREMEELRRLGVDGFVCGALTPDGAVDVHATRELLAAASPSGFTFHRAFDVARDLDAALDSLCALGVPRVLSSGGEFDAARGAHKLAALVERADRRISIMAGGGVRHGNVRAIVAGSGVREVHLSAARIADGPMRWRGARMVFDVPGRDPFTRRETSADEVRALREALRA